MTVLGVIFLLCLLGVCVAAERMRRGHSFRWAHLYVWPMLISGTAMAVHSL